MRVPVWVVAILFLIPGSGHGQVQLVCNELLGRPTNSSITIHASANKTLAVCCQYRIDSLTLK